MGKADLAAMFCERGKRLQPSVIRSLFPLSNMPEMISLAGGLPNPALFPFKEITISCRDGTTVSVSGTELSTSLQYATSRGLPAFVEWVTQFQKREHNCPSPTDVIVGSGSQNFISVLCEIFLDEHDTLLLEQYTYPGSIAAARPSGCKRQGVAMDKDGMIPSALREILSKWDCSARGPKPKMMYLIPNGQNPTGCGMTLERKREIYGICCEHDVIIVEDDPYYFLTYDEKPLPSFLSMDVEGRVIRLDSFSKVLAAGIRIGFCTAPPPVVVKIEQHIQMSILHANSFSQVAILALLRSWGQSGWELHIKNIKKFYADRAAKFTAILRKYLTGLAEWDDPRAGMFAWLRLTGFPDTKDLIQTRAREKKVLAVPGEFFCANEGPCPYIRLAFSTTPIEDAEEAIKRLASLLQK